MIRHEGLLGRVFEEHLHCLYTLHVTGWLHLSNFLHNVQYCAGDACSLFCGRVLFVDAWWDIVDSPFVHIRVAHLCMSDHRVVSARPIWNGVALEEYVLVA